MLQIATGRFFRSNDLLEDQGSGVLYSNFVWVDKIVTSGASLVPAYGKMGTTPRVWVVPYVTRIEKAKGTRQQRRVGEAEIIEQFQLLCTLGMEAFFHGDRDVVQRVCSTRSTGRPGQKTPAIIAGRILHPEVRGTPKSKETFVKFIEKTIRLPRKKYRAVISCARAFSDSLVVVSYNIHLAYSMLVYALESLSQGFEKYPPKREHLNGGLRRDLDKILVNEDPKIAGEIRDLLIRKSRTKSMARFIEFTSSHVRDSFYLDEAESHAPALRPSDLRRALTAAYEMRSGFVHGLEPIRQQICLPQIATGLVFMWGRQPYLTYRGLLMLVRHVLRTFVAQGEVLDREDFDWRSNLPGTIEVEVAPQYWTHKSESFSEGSAIEFLGGFLRQLNGVKENGGAITDLSGVVNKAMALFPQAKQEKKPAMLILIALYNQFIEVNHKIDGWLAFFEKHQTVIDRLCLERLVYDLILGYDWSWTSQECAQCIEDFLEKSHYKNQLELPRAQMCGLMLRLYNMFLLEEDLEVALNWGQRALLDQAGDIGRQATIRETMERFEKFDIPAMMWPEKVANQ